MSSQLRVLLVEDSEDDAELLVYELERSGYDTTYQRVDTAAAMNAALNDQTWDVVVADYTMPYFSAPAALNLLKERGLDLPFIIVSGSIGEDIAVAAMKVGAHDYIMKGQLARLAPAVERELREASERHKRRAAETALREQEERFRLLIENASDIIMVLGADGTIHYKSPSIKRVLGYPLGYLIGKNLFNYVHPEDRENVITTFTKIIQNPGMSLSIEFRCHHQDGCWRILEAVGQHFLDYSQEARIVVNSRDITERKQAEEIRNALTKEREISERKFQFVSMMAHEFRNPLSTIMMSADLLRNYRDKATEAQKEQYFNRLQAAAHNMSQMLEDVLTISRAEVGKLDLNPITLDLIQFCHDLAEELQFNIGERHIIHFLTQDQGTEQIEKPILVSLDERLLWHILTNLLSNAIKYSPEGGNVYFTLSYHNREAIFKIRDEGIGIPLEDQKRLFDTFHRARNVGKIPGTGLGLAIVKRYVELQGGKITLDSEVGVGTTFTVTLPLERVVRKRLAND